jgi:DNA polymerase elongation subunit (family B)
VVYLPTELALLHAFVAVVRAYDPDMLVGWEVQNASVGYLAERAAHVGLGLLKALSRTPPGGAADGKEQVSAEEGLNNRDQKGQCSDGVVEGVRCLREVDLSKALLKFPLGEVADGQEQE